MDAKPTDSSLFKCVSSLSGIKTFSIESLFWLISKLLYPIHFLNSWWRSLYRLLFFWEGNFIFSEKNKQPPGFKPSWILDNNFCLSHKGINCKVKLRITIEAFSMGCFMISFRVQITLSSLDFATIFSKRFIISTELSTACKQNGVSLLHSIIDSVDAPREHPRS